MAQVGTESSSAATHAARTEKGCAAPSDSLHELAAGTRIEILWGGDVAWYAATVLGSRLSRSRRGYIRLTTVRYDKNDKNGVNKYEHDLDQSPWRIQPPPPYDLAPGTRIDVQWGTDGWYAATVVRSRVTQRLRRITTVRYDEADHGGDVYDHDLEESPFRLYPSRAPPSPSSPPPYDLLPGTRIDVQWGTDGWYAATVVRSRVTQRNSRYTTVRYDEADQGGSVYEHDLEHSPFRLYPSRTPLPLPSSPPITVATADRIPTPQSQPLPPPTAVAAANCAPAPQVPSRTQLRPPHDLEPGTRIDVQWGVDGADGWHAATVVRSRVTQRNRRITTVHYDVADQGGHLYEHDLEESPFRLHSSRTMPTQPQPPPTAAAKANRVSVPQSLPLPPPTAVAAANRAPAPQVPSRTKPRPPHDLKPGTRIDVQWGVDGADGWHAATVVRSRVTQRNRRITTVHYDVEDQNGYVYEHDLEESPFRLHSSRTMPTQPPPPPTASAEASRVPVPRSLPSPPQTAEAAAPRIPLLADVLFPDLRAGAASPSPPPSRLSRSVIVEAACMSDSWE